VAGIGDVLRHNYESIAAQIMWARVRYDLAPLDKVCHDAAAKARIWVESGFTRVAD